MDAEQIRRRAWFSWACLTLVAVLCGALEVLQYRWINEVAEAERGTLQADLQGRLSLLRQNFDDQIATACGSLVPSTSEIETRGRDEAYLERYRAVERRSEPAVRGIALAVPKDDDITLWIPNTAKRQFVPAAWPADWEGVRDRLRARWRGEPVRPDSAATVVEFPRFAGDRDGPGGRERPREQEWLLIDLNVDYLTGTLLPGLLNRYLGDNGRLEYDSEVVVKQDPARSVYRSNLETNRDQKRPDGFAVDAAIPLLNVRPFQRPREERGRHHEGPPMPPPGEAEGRGPGNPSGPLGAGAWLLKVHHRVGSLDRLVSQARARNIVLSGAILVLILAAITMLVRYLRQAQTVAELQMNFVAGVSHEFRTPLTVIRTAAYNLRGALANRPEQVERYGKLIGEECEKLAVLVQQVLRYGRVKAGFVIGDREPLVIGALIEDSFQENSRSLEAKGLTVERHIGADLPLVLADPLAMKQAFQNLLDNAVKYGTGREPWIGVSAALAGGKDGPAVEIRIADRGPGIPRDERERIFDPFFRGRRALEDQVHGTGLGLNLVKKIIEAHGGTIRVNHATPGSPEATGAEFIIRLPAAPKEVQQNAFADSVG